MREVSYTVAGEQHTNQETGRNVFIQIATGGPNAQQDLLANSIHRLSGYDREITGAWLQYTGSSITNGGAVDLYVGDVNLATLIGQSAGAGGLNLIPVDGDVPGGNELRAIVTVPPAGSSPGLVISMQIDELEDNGMDIESIIGGV